MNDEIPVLQPEENESKRDAINKCVALKAMPHIYEKIKKLWGFPAFFNYMDNVMLVEPGRENRQGFPADVYRELNDLDKTFTEFPDEVAHPSLIASDREEIKQIIKERSIKINFTTGDRR